MLAISYADKKLSPSEKTELSEIINFIRNKLNLKTIFYIFQFLKNINKFIIKIIESI